MQAFKTPWHRESFDRFLESELPKLLGERLPLSDYEIGSRQGSTCRVRVSVAGKDAQTSAKYEIPQPDEDGVFVIDGQRRVVVPMASYEDLADATIRCVGEQMLDFVAERLGEAPSNGEGAALPWDEELLRSWLPLDSWLKEFMTGQRTAQALQETNWLDAHTHLRRIMVENVGDVISPGQRGRACPIEAPEGPNLGHVMTVSLGATIRQGRVVILDDCPEAGLGLSASMIPFLEYGGSSRLLMGANMMRQWVPPTAPEPALVQTGKEPAEPGFWCGHNLLTALIPWGADTFEDGLVISESAAARLRYEQPVEPGDKFSNRHGVKGVLSRILPDADMPHLPDGTPVELCYSPMRIHARHYFGQVLEAAWGRVAVAEGESQVAPPYHAPTRDELRARLVAAGLPDDGLEQLVAHGNPLSYRSCVGYIYWGLTFHVARTKMRATVCDPRYAAGAGFVSELGQVSGEMEYAVLRDLGAHANLAEQVTFRAEGHPDAATLARRIAAGEMPIPSPLAPRFLQLARRLAAAGIEAQLEGRCVALRLASPAGEGIDLAMPVPHPWLPDRQLSRVGAPGEPVPGLAYSFVPVDEAGALAKLYDAVQEANNRLARLAQGRVPASLREAAHRDLAAAVGTYVDMLVGPAQVRPRSGRLAFSGRSVIAPGVGLELDQVGLADEMAWTLFGPLAARELGDEQQVLARTDRAAKALDGVMARSWVIVNRAPTIMPTAMLAFRPVRQADRTVRIHPLACRLLNADYDGDQVAVFLPLTEAAQREAGELLSVAAHVRRDPKLLADLVPTFDTMWALAILSLEPDGRKEIAAILSLDPAQVPVPLTRSWLADAANQHLRQHSVGAAIHLLERLAELGFRVAQASGPSLSPFIEVDIATADAEKPDDQAWELFLDRADAMIGGADNYRDPNLGPQLLAVQVVRTGDAERLRQLLVGREAVADAGGALVPIRHGVAQGLTPDEMWALTAESRRSLAEIVGRWPGIGQELRQRSEPKGLGVLARAMRARRPAVVLALAAANEEVDPLTDLDSRLLVGLI